MGVDGIFRIYRHHFSCKWKTGVAAFLNGCTMTPMSKTPAHPMMLGLRNGLELKDINKDTKNDTWDVAVATSSKRTGRNRHNSGGNRNRNRLINRSFLECCPRLGIKTRCCEDNTLLPGQNLVATNHFRCAENPAFCYRYKRIVEQLYVNMDITPESSWELLAKAAGQKFRNIHAIQYLPEAGLLKWATAKVASPAYDETASIFDPGASCSVKNPKTLNMAQPHVRTRLRPNFPNPFNAQTEFEFDLAESQLTRLKIFDMLGREVASVVDAPPAGRNTSSKLGCVSAAQRNLLLSA